jgi:hypothetical protein
VRKETKRDFESLSLNLSISILSQWSCAFVATSVYECLVLGLRNRRRNDNHVSETSNSNLPHAPYCLCQHAR